MLPPPLDIDPCVWKASGVQIKPELSWKNKQPTCSSNPMYINCIIHCCTSGLLRSQTFLLVLLSLDRNSRALEEGTATEDFERAVPAPATGWKQQNERHFQNTFHLSCYLNQRKKILWCQMVPSLFLKIRCKLLSLDTSVQESQKRANEWQYETPYFKLGELHCWFKIKPQPCQLSLISKESHTMVVWCKS